MDEEKLVEFPWNDEPVAVKVTDKQKPFVTKLKKLQVPIVISSIVLGLMYFKIGSTETRNTKPISKTEIILVPMIPFGKGEKVNPQFLKKVEIHLSKLTKTQRLNLLIADDLDRVDGNIFAKRSLAPYKPIFWNHLNYRNSTLSTDSKINITYGKEQRSSP